MIFLTESFWLSSEMGVKAILEALEMLILKDPYW